MEENKYIDVIDKIEEVEEIIIPPKYRKCCYTITEITKIIIKSVKNKYK